MAITRITPTDDSGSGTDGTIFTAAWMTTVYDSIEDTWAWDPYTPVWGNSGTANNLGNGSIVGAYFQVGKMVHWRVVLTWGSTTASGSGNWTFTLPVTSDAYGEYGGTAMMVDSSAGLHYPGSVVPQSTTVVALNYRAVNAAAAGVTPVYHIQVNATAPFTWATSDGVDVRGHYVAA